MAGSKMYVSSIIDVDLWNKAKWAAMLWYQGGAPGDPPTVGFIFNNDAAGQDIFKKWRSDRFGASDIFDEMRISIIKGKNAKDGQYYHVHVGLYFDAVLKRAQSQGMVVDDKLMTVTLSRIQKFPSGDNYKSMMMLMDGYEKAGRYVIIPCGVTPSGVVPHFDLAIAKTKIEMRDESDVSVKDDPDSIVFQ